MNEQKLVTIHGLEGELENLVRAKDVIDACRDALNREVGAREVAVAITNLETAILWLAHAIGVARRS